MHELLDYEASILMDIHDDSSLLVLAEGLGLDTITYLTLKLHSDPHNLLLVSNYRVLEARFLSELLAKDKILHTPVIISAEVTGKDREAMYKRGGVVFVSSRVLVVDLLMNRMPASLVSGLLILRAHELGEACQDNFAIRLLRERNPSIFIKALSDNAISLTSGYNHAERIMLQAGISKLVLWPRFNVQVISCLADTQPQVEEVRVKLTENMRICQSCLLELINACIKELVAQNPMLNIDELSVENALLPNFNSLINLFLDPMWNQLSTSSRRLMDDITNLRRLSFLLIGSDAVTFLSALEGCRQAALSTLGASGLEQERRGPRSCPSWFLLNESDRLLTAARSRVYSDFSKKAVRIELNPKWNSVASILSEIDRTMNSLAATEADKGEVLILLGRENTARTLERFLLRGHRFSKWLLSQTNHHPATPKAKASTSDKSKGSSLKHQELTLTQICKQSTSVDESEPQKEVDSDSGTDSQESDCAPTEPPVEGNAEKEQPKLPIGCRRVLVSSRLLTARGSQDSTKRLEVILRVAPNISREDSSASISQRSDFLEVFSHRLAYVLDSIQPRYVLLYEPRVAWVRELEVHKARRHITTQAEQAAGPKQTRPLSVFFMLYEDSIEEQRYLTQLRREKEAFESLIKLSSRIVIPKDAFSLPPVFTSDSSAQSTNPRVIVDMREFRSELPALLHRKGLQVVPMTLSIADYILAPHLCVERKSVSDLIGSLNSGRLYQQCTAMSRHYPNPVLLVEFSMPTKIIDGTPARGLNHTTGFSLYTGRHSIVSGGEFNARHLLSKLTLLTIHFPNLRFVWSVTPYCTAELFAELKQGLTEPSVDRLPQDGEHLEDHNVEAVDMLLKLPGISWKNYHRIITHVSSLFELAQLSLEQLTAILDSLDCATKLYNFLHSSCDVLRKRETTSAELEDGSRLTAGMKRPKAASTRGPRFALAGRLKVRSACGTSRST
ncbi:unnamed protein product [Dicrocoelium dendriticum]|nr:unnamed protein product [Dicrocoelium dendriticum]